MVYLDFPVMIEKKINALIEDNYYSSMSEAVKDAFRTLFDAKPHLKIISAVSLYKKEEVSISKASEIAGVSIEEFKEILLAKGIEREIEPNNNIDENVKEILERRA